MARRAPMGWRMRLKRALVRIRQRIPPGLRFITGLGLIALGLLGFLPVLGFWMIPLGLAVAALDIRSLCIWLRRTERRRR